MTAEHILHILDGQRCTCTPHDIGFNCRRALTPDALRREVTELIRIAFLSGFDPAAIGAAFTHALAQQTVEARK